MRLMTARVSFARRRRRYLPLLLIV